MSAAAAGMASAPAPSPARRSLLGRATAPFFSLARRLLGWALGALLCMTPATAVLAQGWLVGRMRVVACAAARRRTERPPEWATAQPPSGAEAPAGAEAPGWMRARLAGALGLLREGVSASLALFLGFAPFCGLMLLSWWAGWENSFNKGYEQSWVGPTLGLLGAALALPLLARAPLALAHLAVERRFSAFFERRRVATFIRCAGWEHVALALAFVLAAAPLFAAKATPVFIEQIDPAFHTLSPEEARAFATRWRLASAVYLFAALWMLRGWSARLYAKARLRAERGVPARGGLATLGRLMRLLLISAVWFGLVAQIYVGQFLNHDWSAWLNPPLLGLPVVPALGG